MSGEMGEEGETKTVQIVETKTVQIVEDDLLKHLMNKNRDSWAEVVSLCRDDPTCLETSLTIHDESVLHVAVSSYDPEKSDNDDEFHVKEIINIAEEQGSVFLLEVLSMQNVRGDTPLHLAAVVGWTAICRLIASKDRELISIHNKYGETPLFMAAHRGKEDAFRFLHQHYYENSEKLERDYLLCRRKDGDNILHKAISGQFFLLADQIIEHYPWLATSVNVDGESPLHVLARKPHLFQRSSQLSLYESIMYNSIFWKYKNQNGSPANDEENQQKFTKAEEDSQGDGAVPVHGTTYTLLRKFALEAIDFVTFGAVEWIRKIRDKKKKHSLAFKTMCKLIDSESQYKYYNHGGKKPPAKELEDVKLAEPVDIPDAPSDGHQTLENTLDVSVKRISDPALKKQVPEMVEKIINTYLAVQDLDHSNPKNVPADHVSIKSSASCSALLEAVKWGIPEMVQKIIKTFPSATQDTDSDGKNVLMIAVENRQIHVLDYLLQFNLPEYMFHQIDNQGNSILHLAAKMGDFQPWHIPAISLHVQWEIKWYKHVKSSIPPLPFARHNDAGNTPMEIFAQTHDNLIKEGVVALKKTSESSSVIAALVATVAFASIATVPGGLNEDSGRPVFRDRIAFDIFAIASLVALCLSVSALILFLTIITPRFIPSDFRTRLPKRLFTGLTCLFGSIIAMLVSFFAGHTFILSKKFRWAQIPIYSVTSLPVVLFAIGYIQFYVDLVQTVCQKGPVRRYKVFPKQTIHI